jgi:hypothetical protein
VDYATRVVLLVSSYATTGGKSWLWFDLSCWRSPSPSRSERPVAGNHCCDVSQSKDDLQGQRFSIPRAVFNSTRAFSARILDPFYNPGHELPNIVRPRAFMGSDPSRSNMPMAQSVFFPGTFRWANQCSSSPIRATKIPYCARRSNSSSAAFLSLGRSAVTPPSA